MSFQTCDCPCHVRPILHCKPCCPESYSTVQKLTRCKTCLSWVKIEGSVHHLACEPRKPIKFKTITLPGIKKQE